MGRRSLSGRLIQLFFGTNAFVAIFLLSIITLFLFRQAIGFFPESHDHLSKARLSGMEAAVLLHQDLDRFFRILESVPADSSLFSGERRQALWGKAIAARDWLVEQGGDRIVERFGRVQEMDGTAAPEERSLWRHETEHIASEWSRLREGLRKQLAREADSIPPSGNDSLAGKIADWGNQPVLGPGGILDGRLPGDPFGFGESLASFFFGQDWVTNSFQFDRFGIWPLLSGTLLIAFIALAIAVPGGLLCAVYVNQFARRWERTILKPSLEFIAALPTVLIGFLGVVYWSDFLVHISHFPPLSWLPGFPFVDRFNALAAGTLLGFMGIPIIFTLSEEALNIVPRDYAEASYAVGASSLQTSFLVVVPAGISGLISASLLGFARIIGESMIVLLVAGNRILAPDFGLGPAVLVEPVHTMTGLLAQEMGEVSLGSLHYRALFMVAVCLFCLALILNHLADWLGRRQFQYESQPLQH